MKKPVRIHILILLIAFLQCATAPRGLAANDPSASQNSKTKKSNNTNTQTSNSSQTQSGAQSSALSGALLNTLNNSMSLGQSVTSAVGGVASSTLPTFTPALNTTTQSNYGFKQAFYQYAPYMGKQDLSQTFTKEVGTDPSATYSGPTELGTILSGRAPSVTAPPPVTQAQQVPAGQAVPHPFMQLEQSNFPNPLLDELGPPTNGIPYEHLLPNNLPVTGIDQSTFDYTPWLKGVVDSDLTNTITQVMVGARTAQKNLDPNLQGTQASYQGGAQQTADAASADASGAFQANMATVSSPLINVANEMAATPPSSQSSQSSQKTLGQSIWIVQQMYKGFFLPFALLLLLVGTILNQTKTYVQTTMSTGNSIEMTWQPFEGILRALVAIFLIGAMQLIVSYSIDFGNSMTDAVAQVVDSNSINQWTQTIMNPQSNMTPAQVTAANSSESTASSTTRVVVGTAQALLNTSLMLLTMYQLVMVCYLFLLAPIAAAMFAFPNGVGSLFQGVFSGWLNGLSSLILWRFWWCIILLTMSTRIQWLKDMGSYDASNPWEPLVYTAFMVMLVWVPFNALSFRPGDMVGALLDKAAGGQQGGQQAGQAS
jgi:hypothetical protein